MPYIFLTPTNVIHFMEPPMHIKGTIHYIYTNVLYIYKMYIRTILFQPKGALTPFIRVEAL